MDAPATYQLNANLALDKEHEDKKLRQAAAAAAVGGNHAPRTDTCARELIDDTACSLHQ